jgi:hypothetical protein
MSMLTFGPPVVLDGPLPEAPKHCLLNVPGVVVDPGDERYLNGAQIYGYPVSLPTSWDVCSEGTFRPKADGDDFPVPVFASFVLYLPISCSAMSIGNPDEFRDRARKALDARESWGVEQVLSQGNGIASNPYFGDVGVVLPAGNGAVSPAAGLAYLEEAIGATGQRGLIHSTPGPVSRWFELDTDALVTSNGTPIASGGGYAGVVPTGGTAAGAGQSWVFATGPVEVRHTEGEVLDISEVLDRSNNDVTYRAERHVLATWDTELQVAVKIAWGT